MTEMLHIFLSNRPGEVRPGHHRRRRARLRPARSLDEDGREVAAGHARHAVRARRTRPPPGTGRATTPRARCSRASGCAPATPTCRTPTATTPASGRTGDMLKASGIWVSPGRGRGPAARARRRSPRPSWWRPRTPTGWRSRSPTSCSRPAPIVDRGRADRVLPRRAAVVQAAAPGRLRRRATRPPPPARSAGSSCAQLAATVLLSPAPVA